MNNVTTGTTGPVIRRATPADADAVMDMVLEIAVHENDAHAVETTVERWREHLARPTVYVLLAYDHEQPVGYVSAVRQLNLWLGRDILALDDLYVRPGHRDCGMGAQLMAGLAALAAPEQLLIRWEMLADNHAAGRFYSRLGATLRPKLIALWKPDAYHAHAAAAAPLTA